MIFLTRLITARPSGGTITERMPSRPFVDSLTEKSYSPLSFRCLVSVRLTVRILSLDERPQNDEEDGDDGESLYDRLASPYVKTPEQICMEKETYEEVHHALGMISERERTYLRYRYGFDDDVLHDREETAGHFHLSPGRARSIERQALDNVRLELPWW